MLGRTSLLLAHLASLFLGLAHAKPHEHGVAQLEISLSGQELSIRFASPLDAFLGWERAPRQQQEINLYRQLRKDLAQHAFLLNLPAQAACSLQAAQVSDPHRLDVENQKAPDKQKTPDKPAAEHQDLVVEWSIRCDQPSQLKRVGFQGFDRYKRLRRVDVIFNMPAGVGKARLTSRQADLQLP
jgi:hypothetical protein